MILHDGKFCDATTSLMCQFEYGYRSHQQILPDALGRRPIRSVI